MNQRILITGASGGFGALITRDLLAAGHTVVASMREPEGRRRAIADELLEHVLEREGLEEEQVQPASRVWIALGADADGVAGRA